MILKLNFIKGSSRFVHVDDIEHNNGAISFIETRVNEYTTHQTVNEKLYKRADLMSDVMTPIASYVFDGVWLETTDGDTRQQLLG